MAHLRKKRAAQASADSKKNPQLAAGEMALERLLALAEYELEHDPYRGMLSPNSPWSQCQWLEEISDDESAAGRKVFRTCHCTCPSLVQWTEKHDVELSRRRKRKRKSTGTPQYDSVLGRRPNDPNIQCACDFNPLCLASLGGVMDELLEKAAKQMQNEEDIGCAEVKMHDSQSEVIELDADSEAADDSIEGPLEKRGRVDPDSLKETYTSDESDDAEPGEHRPSGVYQMETKAEHLELDPEKENSVYSPMTAEQIKQVRKAYEIDTPPIRSYVEGTILAHLDDSMTLESYMDQLRKWHDSLSFSNPLLTTAPFNDKGKLRISIPPGIKNLGATCYLNTQLQCLARMTSAFLDGIFSWTPSDENHQMNQVLSTMQLLFARMVHGAEGTLTTQDFSSALGLENDEMQDPNEFARLLFERMHESFQQCSGKGVKEDLSQLLPKLFHGVTTYETTCLTCQQTSERNEGFTDLSLPIVHPPTKETNRKGGQMSITEAFVGASDTNLQYCLNRYICAEELSGDNQYWCEACQTKRDAQRTISFQELPPLLNVQISRYVFDRKKFVKKKLTDKVLLPLVLTVPLKGKKGDSKYLLCAVMKHHGASAYQGHYVAEAMDWQSGTWFEFNDEKVSVLDGPGCSYAPQELDSADTKKKLKGSQDAYNMYYVEESFLARCAAGFLQGQREQTRNGTNQVSVLAKVANERKHRYAMLTDMCLNDGKVASRLIQRRLEVMKSLSKHLSSQTGSIGFRGNSCVLGDESCAGVSTSPVWVDGEMLRQFLSCDKTDRSSIVPSSGPLLKHKRFLCEHQTGLHPRIARRGKLLPRSIYDAYVSLLLGERLRVNGDAWVDTGEVKQFDDNDVNDCVITPECNMYCKSCADSYGDELRDKIEAVDRLVHLFRELDPKKTFISLEPSDEGSSEENSEVDERDFLVSRKFVTRFRTCVSNLLKSVGAFAVQSQLTNRGIGNETVCAGLDTLDLSDFDLDKVAATDSRPTSSSKEELDYFVNSSITCKHGHCHAPDNRTVRRVSGEVWTQLKCVFPNAIAFEVKKGDPCSYVRCELCDKLETDEEAFAEKLRDWALVTSTSLPKITKGKRTVEELHFMLLDTDTDDESADDKGDKSVHDLYLVYGEDMDSWRAALKSAKAHMGKDSSVVTKEMIDILFSHRKENVDECQMVHPTEPFNGSTNVSCYKGWRPRPLICSEHHLPLQRAVFKVDLLLKESEPIILHGQNNVSDPCIAHVSSSVEALTYTEYFAFLGSVFDLGLVLFPCETEEEEQTDDIGDGKETSSQRSLHALLHSLVRTHHPRLQSPLCALGLNTTSLEPITQAAYAQLVSAHFVDGVCQEASCNDAFAKENAQTASQEKTGQGSTNVVDLLDEDINESERSKLIAATEEVANIDSSFSLRVFEFDSVAEDETVVSSILGLPKYGSTTGTSDIATARRSSRKRKASYPSGHILREDSLRVGAHHNIASVRLLLYQACLDFRIDQNLTMIIPLTLSENGVHLDNHIDMTGEDAPSVSSSTPEYTSFELPFDWNDRSLEEVVAIATEGSDRSRNGNSMTRPLSKIFLFRKNQPSDKKNDKDVTSVPNETLLDALFEIANVSSPAASQAPDTRPGENKSRRRTERGFRGTLLHSSAPKANESINVHSPDPANKEETSEEFNAKQCNDVDNQMDDGHAETVVHAASPRSGEIRDVDTRTGKDSDSNFVVLDESDDEKLSTRTGSGKQQKRPPARHVSRALDETLSVLVSHSGSVPPLQNGSRDELSAMDSEGHRLLRSTIVNPMEEEVVNKLVEAVSQGQESDTTKVIHAKCREAVKWALVTNSSRASIPELIDSAFAKYLAEC